MKILFLDDDMERHAQFKRLIHPSLKNSCTYVETVTEAKKALDEEKFDLIFLDHDLGGEQLVESSEDTGYEVAKYLAENKLQQNAFIVVHSFNPVGATNMINIIKNYGYEYEIPYVVQKVPFNSKAFWLILDYAKN